MGWTENKVGSNIATKKYIRREIERLFPQNTIKKLYEGKTVYGEKRFQVTLKYEDCFGERPIDLVIITRRKNAYITYKIVTADKEVA